MTARPPRIGDLLGGRWRLDAQLGHGAMGDVFRAHDLILERDVAAKVLADEYVADSTMLARFRREAMSSSRLAHPNIVATLDFGLDGVRPYMIMELVDGRPLDLVLGQDGPLDPARALSLARDVAWALAAAHEHGLVHRDVKPSNVMVTSRDGREVGRLLDFGVARPTDVRRGLTMVGIAVGTPGYAAPEQIVGAEVGPSADLFALGCSLFEMLTGELPWRATDPAELLAAPPHEVPRALAGYRSEVPPTVAKLVQSLLRRAVADRPPSAAAVAVTLESILERELSTRELHDVSQPIEVADAALVAAGFSGDNDRAQVQLDWFRLAVEGEGGRLAQRVGREMLAQFPSAEASMRLTRTCPAGGVDMPRLAVHVGSVVAHPGGMLLGTSVRTALRLARVAAPGEVLVTAAQHEALGYGWKSRLTGRGRFDLGVGSATAVFALLGTQPVSLDAGTLEAHADGLHWRCSCRAHGPIPETADEGTVRVRCSMCSRLMELDLDRADEAGEPAKGTPHPLSSIILQTHDPAAAERSRTDLFIVDALAGLDDVGETP